MDIDGRDKGGSILVRWSFSRRGEPLGYKNNLIVTFHLLEHFLDFP